MLRLKKYSFITFMSILFGSVFILAANLINSPYLGIACIIALTISFTFYCIDDFTKRIALAMFAACLFTFQLAGIVIPALSGENEWLMGFTEKEYVMICNCLYVTSITLILTTYFWERCKIRMPGNLMVRLWVFNDKYFNVRSLQKWAYSICIISSVIAIAGEGQRMLHALANGYMSLYGGYSTSTIVSRMLIVSKISMFIGLAAKPSKKRSYMYLIMGLPVAVMNLIEGSRSSIVMYVIFYLYYFYVYNDWGGVDIDDIERRKKFRKFIVGVLIAVCVATPLLYVYGFVRGGTSFNLSNPFDGILRFFSSQGGSVELIGNAIHYKGQLPGICYSLGSIVDRIQGNNYEQFTVESALNTNNFGNIMTYMYSSYNYLTLHTGVGSSYIAEVYYDFGYVGLVVVNIIIGFVLKLLTSFKQVSYLGKSLLFMLFYYMLTIPRAPLLNPIDNIFSTSSLMTVFLILLLSKKRI